MKFLQRVRPFLVTCGWATSLSSLTLGAIFQGQLLPAQPPGNLFPEVLSNGPLGSEIFYGGIFVVSLLAATILAEAGTAIVSFFASYGLAAVITYLVLALPGFVGAFAFPEALSKSAISFTFATSFPLPLLVELTGTLIGVWLSERF